MKTNNINIKHEAGNTVIVTIGGESRSYFFGGFGHDPQFINYTGSTPCNKSYNLAVGYWLGCANEDGSYPKASSFDGDLLH